MSVLQVSDLAFRHDAQAGWLFRNVSFAIGAGDRIGLIGPNGSGKTSLLRILAGELRPASGAIVRASGLRTACVRQQVVAPDGESLLEFVLGAEPRLAALRRQCRALEASLDDDTSALRYAEAVADYEAAGGYPCEARAERVLAGLGFDPLEHALPMGCLSSGQRSRAELARTLLAPADLLLADEPTNHLDAGAQAWLARHLAGLAIACVLISHDRALLEQVTTRTFELRDGQLRVYGGAFAFAREQRALAERQAWAAYEARQRRTAAMARASDARSRAAARVGRAPEGARHSKDFYRAKAARVQRTARILRERTAREPQAEKPRLDPGIPVLDFVGVRRTGGPVLAIRGLTKAFGGRPLFDGLSLWIRDGERVALAGANGAGKTSLFRVILGQEMPDAGEVIVAGGTRIGYFSQEGEHMDPAATPLAHCLAANPDETWVRTLLACLKVRADQAQQPIGALSGGERAKVALAALLAGGANLLLLDEPTNHLDLDAREALERALAQFPGATLFVSHDQAFVRALAHDVVDLGAPPVRSASAGPLPVTSGSARR